MREVSRSSSEDTSGWKRAAVAAAGGTMALLGLRRRSFPGFALAAAGGWLAYRGLRGQEGRRIELVSLEDAEASAEAIDVQRTLQVDASADEVRTFLAEPANLDAVLGETGSVEALDETTQRWTLATPLGGALTWEMHRAHDAEGEDVIGWVSAEDTGLEVQIATKPTGDEAATEATLHVGFEPPGGAVGRAVLDRLDVVPHAIVGRSMRRAKRLIEADQMPPLEPGPSPPTGEAVETSEPPEPGTGQT